MLCAALLVDLCGVSLCFAITHKPKQFVTHYKIFTKNVAIFADFFYTYAKRDSSLVGANTLNVGVFMKKFQRVLFVSAAVSALIAPMSALEVLKDDDKSLEVYGSVRGYVGFGATMSGASTTMGGATPSYGSALYGLQGNSRLGVKAKVGNLEANAELGLSEPDGFRQMWGAYTFGSAGSLLFGKTDTPSVAKSIFSSDLADTEQGSAGFGGLRTSSRKLQLSYSIAGFTIALVDDYAVVNARGAQNEAIPRIAASYYLQNEDKTLDFQVGGAYKYYNLGIRPGQGEGNPRFDGFSGSAFHIFTAVKSQMMEKRTNTNAGGYSHVQIFNDGAWRNVHRVGAYVESGYKISDMLSGVLGLGYQLSAATPAGATNTTATAHTFMVMAQLPVKLEKSLTITPQVGYYGSIQGVDTGAQASNTLTQNGLLAFVRLRYDF